MRYPGLPGFLTAPRAGASHHRSGRRGIARRCVNRTTLVILNGAATQHNVGCACDRVSSSQPAPRRGVVKDLSEGWAVVTETARLTTGTPPKAPSFRLDGSTVPRRNTAAGLRATRLRLGSTQDDTVYCFVMTADGPFACVGTTSAAISRAAEWEPVRNAG